MATIEPVEPAALDLCQLAYLAGLRANEVVLVALHRAGFAGLRQSHGFVFQHLLSGPKSVGVLADALGITQQAVSKTVIELERLGYVARGAGQDARTTHVALTARGKAAVAKARKLRGSVDRDIQRAAGALNLKRAKLALSVALHVLGGTEEVRERRVREPDRAPLPGSRQKGSKQS